MCTLVGSGVVAPVRLRMAGGRCTVVVTVSNIKLICYGIFIGSRVNNGAVFGLARVLLAAATSSSARVTW